MFGEPVDFSFSMSKDDHGTLTYAEIGILAKELKVFIFRWVEIDEGWGWANEKRPKEWNKLTTLLFPSPAKLQEFVKSLIAGFEGASLRLYEEAQVVEENLNELEAVDAIAGRPSHSPEVMTEIVMDLSIFVCPDVKREALWKAHPCSPDEDTLSAAQNVYLEAGRGQAGETAASEFLDGFGTEGPPTDKDTIAKLREMWPDDRHNANFHLLHLMQYLDQSKRSDWGLIGPLQEAFGIELHVASVLAWKYWHRDVYRLERYLRPLLP